MNSLQTLGITELQNGPTIFQLSRAGFFTYKCKSPHENEENGVKLQFDSLLILMFHSPMITLPAESLWSSLKSQKRRSDSADIFKVLWFTDHPAIWMSQTSLMLDKSVLPVFTCVLYSKPILHNKTDGCHFDFTQWFWENYWFNV